MYEVIYDDGLFYVSKDGSILDYLGGYIEPLTCELIIKEIENEQEI